MPHFSFLFDCGTTPVTEISESHPFGPTNDGSGFNTDLGVNITNQETTPIKAITRGRLFSHGPNLLLQPFYVPVNNRDGLNEEESEWTLFKQLFGQPFAFCYKNVTLSPTLLAEHIRTKAFRQGVDASTIWEQVSSAFRDGTESIFVNADNDIGTASGPSIGFEVFYISNGISEVMPGRITGLEIIRRLYSNQMTRRIDPIYFFNTIPNNERINFAKNGTQENPIFSRFTRRVLIEIRNEYDEYYIGNLVIRGGNFSIQEGGNRVFSNANHGMVALDVVLPNDIPQSFTFQFHADHSVFTKLPSDSEWNSTINEVNVRAPYHYATQIIYMNNSDHINNWFHQNTLSRYTENNHVEYLIDGRATFSKMIEEIEKTHSEEHYIRIAGWIMYLNLQMNERTTLESILQRKHDEGVKINILIYNNLIDRSAGIDSVNFVNRLQNRDGSLRNGRGILDDSVAGSVGSHHQKIMIIKNSEGIVGFCGGVDLNPDRLDDPNHTRPSNPGKAFHDIHSMVKGLSARELDLTFVHRWNTHVQRFQNFISESTEYTVGNDRRLHHTGVNVGAATITILGTDFSYDPNPRLVVLPGSDYIINNNNRNARSFIQVTRTFSQKDAHRLFPFQPNGEVGTLNALKQAISRAQKYIYIEDQYLYPYGGSYNTFDSSGESINPPSVITDSIASSILAQDDVGILASLYSKLQSNPNLVLIFVTSGPEKYDQAPGRGTMTRMTFFIRILRHARQANPNGQDKIIFCYPFRVATSNQIYVHSKLWIIDDIYVKIGSANCGRRSLTHDTETDLHIIDGALQNGHRKFAVAFRKTLWAEHLGIQNKEYLDDLDYALNLWQNLSLLTVANVATYSGYTLGIHNLSWDVIVDPEGRSNPPTNPLIASPLSTYDQ